jgi:hypothetical protein
MGSPSELIAGHRVTDGQRKEAQANGQHDDVEHLGTPFGAHCAAPQSMCMHTNAVNSVPVRNRRRHA